MQICRGFSLDAYTRFNILGLHIIWKRTVNVKEIVSLDLGRVQMIFGSQLYYRRRLFSCGFCCHLTQTEELDPCQLLYCFATTTTRQRTRQYCRVPSSARRRVAVEYSFADFNNFLHCYLVSILHLCSFLCFLSPSSNVVKNEKKNQLTKGSLKSLVPWITSTYECVFQSRDTITLNLRIIQLIPQ